VLRLTPQRYRHEEITKMPAKSSERSEEERGIETSQHVLEAVLPLKRRNNKNARRGIETACRASPCCRALRHGEEITKMPAGALRFEHIHEIGHRHRREKTKMLGGALRPHAPAPDVLGPLEPKK
jgi:hypothetical protein